MLSRSLQRNALISQYARFGFSSQAQYDVAVIGGGPGGYVAAIKAAQRGLKTVCVEKRGTLGGTCLNVGCIPSKALLNSTHHLHVAQHQFKSMGINADNVNVDWQQMLKSKQGAINGLTGGIEYLFKKNGVTYMKGWGKFASQNEVEVDLNAGGSEKISAKNIIIATGSAPNSLPASTGLATDEEYVVSSTGALSLKEIPKRMVVVGGGVIGLELGSVYARLGSEVTVVQHTERVAQFVDKEIGLSFQNTLKKQGMKFLLEHSVVDGVNNKDKGVSLNLKNKAGEAVKIDCDVALISIGRHAYTEGLQLDKAGLEADQRGVIDTNDHWQTKHSHIYGIGDVVKGAMLAHKAEEEGIAAVEHILGEGGHVNYNAIPGVIYTHPEVAWVGKSEEELKAEGVEYAKGTFPMSANSRARTNNDADGMVKILTDKKTDKMLGIWCLGSNAGEMIAEGVLAFEYGASSEDVARTCHAHPTMSEAFKEACMAAHGKPIHF